MRSGGPDIAIVEDVWGPEFDSLSEQFEIVYEPDAWASPDRLLELVRGSRVLVVRNRTSVDRDLLETAERLRIVARAGVGLDNIDMATASDLNITVLSCVGLNATSVAEHALGLALALRRQICHLDRLVREGIWERATGHELRGGVWGLIGMGSTGVETGRLAAAFGMSVLAYDPYLDPDDERLTSVPAELCDVGAIQRRSDVLSLHVPLSPATHRLVDADFLSAMRPGAIIINVSRGGIVDEDALLEALQSGHLAGVGLDVRTVEPPKRDAFAELDNVVLTPHVAGLTHQAQARVRAHLAAGIERSLRGVAH